MTLNDFISTLATGSELDFEDTMQVIESNYSYTPTAFDNGSISNDAGQNEGSCKIFAFAKLNNLDETSTLKCFGRFYQDVLKTPDGDDHGNIRNFMQTGWTGIHFSGEALS
ncbi:HopJ type III effector protein [Neptuniibacter sp. 1_MG-2023]|uniref:HopJ type III effector protein n=1 Tax=Neptuniibacter sp. 1_MG-2023 TaxID=3062662 RepID=UPI0026E303C5|nr:HopJ type III effector protein [Neptuniibacter sp. 1_MG-2023]MDO6592644.1 HopJ type III effector protein [Neptuniibacter sp. 1_MG-2023]